jgi:hypothetical protein
MAISKDLFLSILSMDAYNRGYKPSIAGLDETSNGSAQIGNATVTFNLANAGIAAEAQTASFYGLAYKLTQSVGTLGNTIAGRWTILSYRGTDRLRRKPFITS